MFKRRQSSTGAAAADDTGEADTFLNNSDYEEERPTPSRRSIPSKLPKISTAISINPSPRVSAFEGPMSEMFTYEKKKHVSDKACRHVLILTIVILFMSTLALAGLLIYNLFIEDEIYYCGQTDTEHVSPRDYINPDVFDDLTPAEYNSVTNFLMTDGKMGLTEISTATVNSSYILIIELMLPNKDETIQYLDVGNRKPDREAKVVIVKGDANPPVVKEYIVSIPPNPPMTVKEYVNPSYRKNPIPYTSRPRDPVERRFLFSTIIYSATEQLYPLLMESYRRFFHNCSEAQSNCLEVFDLVPGAQLDGERKTWVWLYPEVREFFQRPLGVQFLVEHSSPDIGNWTIETVTYNGDEFDSVETLLFLYNEKTLTISYMASSNDYVDHFSYLLHELPYSPPPQGPKPFDPDGKRFDIRGQHISYHNWLFYYHMRASTGMMIFDLRFDGARIAYEISLQEVAVFYSGYSSAHGNGYFFDSSWFLGASSMELARGIDCPDTAVYLNTYFHGPSGKPELHKNNVCVFEKNAGIPLRRHYTADAAGRFASYGGLIDYHLVIRTVATVRNVDYILDYVFHNDGVVEATAYVTGYMHATFWPSKTTEPHGASFKNTFNVHQRLFNYKVDLDVAGERNSYTALDVTVEQSVDNLTDANITNIKVNRTLFEFENLNSTFVTDKPQFHVLHSSNEINQYGTKRAYQIVNKSPSLFLLAEVSNIASAQWATYPLVVTRRKETEQQSSSIYANSNPWNPVIDFSDFLDGDDMLDDDLVAWVTIGTHHISGTEDMPSMTTSRGHTSFILSPHNYFNECPSTKSPDVVVIKPSPTGVSNVQSFGRSFASHCLQRYVGPYEYDGFRKVEKVHEAVTPDDANDDDEEHDDDGDDDNDNDR